MSWLEVENLQAGYGKKQVLFDASVAVEKSEIVLLVGPNGSGKSTLLRSIFGQCDVYVASKCHYKGYNLRRISVGAMISNGLAYTPQYRNVFDRLTVLENLEVAIESRTTRSREQLLENIFKRFPDLVPLSRKSAGQLSGGERQLLALAIGLSTIPQILLLDEPLAGLDERHVRKVQGNHKRLSSIPLSGIFDRRASLQETCRTF